jgi:hypothetical protein
VTRTRHSSSSSSWSVAVALELGRDGLAELEQQAPGRGQLVEHEYERLGAVTYLDAWDVRRGKVMGRTEHKGGIAPFDRLVWQVMTKEPYRSARRVFWIVDNGSDAYAHASTGLRHR